MFPKRVSPSHATNAWTSHRPVNHQRSSLITESERIRRGRYKLCYARCARDNRADCHGRRSFMTRRLDEVSGVATHRSTSIFLPFFFHRFSSVLIAPFAFAALLWEWEIFMKSGRASSVEKRSGTRDQNAKKYVATQDFERMAIEWFWEWLRCLEYAYSLNETVFFF